MKKIFVIFIFILFYQNISFSDTLTKQKGVCIKGDCINGEGIFEHKSGLKYEGGWKNNLYHGKGKIYFKNYKKTYEGTWENGAHIPNLEKIKPLQNTIIIPLQIHLKGLFKQDMNSDLFKKYEKHVYHHVNYANYLWKDSGFYFEIIDISKSYKNYPKRFKTYEKFIKEVEWSNNNYKTDLKRYMNFVTEVMDHKKVMNKKALNIYYHEPNFFPKCGQAFGFLSSKNKKKSFITIKYPFEGFCPWQPYTMAHELGHALGLGHPGINGVDLMSEEGWGVNISNKHSEKTKKFYTKHYKDIFK